MTTEEIAIAAAKRINWSKGANKQKLEQDIKDWDEKTGERLDFNGEVIKNMETFCTIVGISYYTIQKYVHGDPKKRRTITNGVGSRPLFSKGDQKFIADTITLQDRLNDGLIPAAVVDFIIQSYPPVVRAVRALLISISYLSELLKMPIKISTSKCNHLKL